MNTKETKVNEIKEEIENENGENIGKIVGGSLLGAVIGGLTFMAGSNIGIFAKEMEIAMKMFSALSVLTATGISVNKALEIKYNKMELNHLNKVLSEGIKKNERLDDKRKSKIKSLDEIKSKKEAKRAMLRAAEIILATVCTVGGVGSLFFPNILLPAIASLGLFTGVGILDLIDSKEISKYQARIDNLENDLYLGEYFNSNPNPASSGQSKQRQVVGKEQILAKDNNLNMTQTQTAQKQKVKVKEIKRP